MNIRDGISRRTLLTAATALSPMLVSAKKKRVPVGLELYSVRDQLKENLMETVRKVAQMGYEDVEFYSPYYEWTPDYAKEVRKLLDDLKIKCLSTHNSAKSLSAEGLPKAIELNQILGSKFIVMASSGHVEGLDGWKRVAETLSQAGDKLKPLGLRAGYHNHALEFKPLEGKRPIEVLAANTGKDVMLQLDVGTCVEMGSDPVAWIQANLGRINSLHCKDWSPDRGYKVLFGEGVVPWKKVFEAAERSGGVEFYLVEQEGSDYPPFETAKRCLDTFRKFQS